MPRYVLPRPLLALLLCAACVPARAIDTRLTYQGSLTDSTVVGAPTGSYDLQFTLQDTGGAAIGAPNFVDNATVVAGVFTVVLDFGPTAFAGADRFLQIAVRRGSETGAFTPLTPRTAITPSPYAQTSTTAGFAATVANDSVGTNQVANGTVGSIDIDNSMQRRVSGTCPGGSAIAAIAAGGTVTCEPISVSGGGTIVPIASGASYIVTTDATGDPAVALMVGFGAADPIDTAGAVTIDVSAENNFPFMLPRNGVLDSIAFHARVSFSISLPPGDTITLQAHVYRANFGSNVFSPVGVGVTAPLLTGFVAAGTTVEGTLATNIALSAGDRLLYVVTAQAQGGSGAKSIPLHVSGGLGIK